MAYPFGVVPPCGCAPFPHEHSSRAVHFDSFNCYALSFELAARELAQTPEAQDNEYLQDKICRKYGIFLDNITEDEIHELENQIAMFARY